MTNKHLIIAGCLGAIATIGGLAWFMQPAASSRAPTATTHATTVATAPQPVTQSSSTSATRAASKPVSARMQADFLAARDYRAFVFDAVKRPQEGGKMYAQAALQYCQMSAPFANEHIKQESATTLAQRNTMSAQALEAKQKILGLCSSFTPDELRHMYLNFVPTSSNSADPLLRAYSRMLDANSKQLRDYTQALDQARQADPKAKEPPRVLTKELADAFVELTQMQDPIADVHGFTKRIATDAANDGSIWFDNVRYAKTAPDGQPNYEGISSMIWLASCSLGSTCEAASDAAYICARSNLCGLSPEQIARRAYLTQKKGTEAQFDAALRLLPRMQAAIQNGELKAFFPPQQ